MKNLELIQKALAENDLSALDSLATAVGRYINKSLNFSSPLMLSAHNLKHLQKISSINSDSIMLNLEDGVSEEQKPFALRLCALALLSYTSIDKKLIVRVNALDEGGDEEIRYLNKFQPDAIRVPKVKTTDDVKRALELLDEKIELHLSIETKEAWLNLQNLRVDDRVKVFYLGILDLFADMNLSQSLIKVDNPLMHHILSHFLITSKAIGVKPVSFVFQDYRDSEKFKEWLELEKSMGFNSKGCISPTQASLVGECFKVDKRELQKAREIIRLFEEQKKMGISGFEHELYGFIDEPIYKGALKTLTL